MQRRTLACSQPRPRLLLACWLAVHSHGSPQPRVVARAAPGQPGAAAVQHHRGARRTMAYPQLLDGAKGAWRDPAALALCVGGCRPQSSHACLVRAASWRCSRSKGGWLASGHRAPCPCHATQARRLWAVPGPVEARRVVPCTARRGHAGAAALQRNGRSAMATDESGGRGTGVRSRQQAANGRVPPVPRHRDLPARAGRDQAVPCHGLAVEARCGAKGLALVPAVPAGAPTLEADRRPRCQHIVARHVRCLGPVEDRGCAMLVESRGEGRTVRLHHGRHRCPPTRLMPS